MSNSMIRPKQEAHAKTHRPNAVIKIQTAIRGAAKALRHEIHEYRVDLKAAYARDDH